MSGTLTESLAHLFVLGCFGEGKSAAFGDGLSFDLASCVEDALIAVADEVIQRCSLLQRMSLFLALGCRAGASAFTESLGG
jgi:hypothetical protein